MLARTLPSSSVISSACPREYRSGAIHLGRSDKAESHETHLDPRQQKHQQTEIENGESENKSLNLHGLPPGQVCAHYASLRTRLQGLAARRARVLTGVHPRSERAQGMP